jgi:hypothetical protein
VKAKEKSAQDLSKQFEEFLHDCVAATMLATKLSAEDVFKSREDVSLTAEDR